MTFKTKSETSKNLYMAQQNYKTTAVLLNIQLFQDVPLSAWWAVLQWVGVFIFKVKHSQKNASFLDSLTLKMTL